MSEIKREIKEKADGSFTITDAHSTADILRWLLTQDSKEMILYLLGEISPQRPWVGLTDEEVNEIYISVEEKVNEHWENGGTTMMFPLTLYKAIEQALKEKNT